MVFRGHWKRRSTARMWVSDVRYRAKVTDPTRPGSGSITWPEGAPTIDTSPISPQAAHPNTEHWAVALAMPGNRLGGVGSFRPPPAGRGLNNRVTVVGSGERSAVVFRCNKNLGGEGHPHTQWFQLSPTQPLKSTTVAPPWNGQAGQWRHHVADSGAISPCGYGGATTVYSNNRLRIHEQKISKVSNG